MNNSDTEKYITVYHRTSADNAVNIRTTGIMTAKEDGLFFGTKKEGEISGYGNTVLTFRFPADMLELNDEFPSGEKHYRIPFAKKPWTMDIRKYLII